MAKIGVRRILGVDKSSGLANRRGEYRPSSSGKSSLMRGIHWNSWNPPMETIFSGANIVSGWSDQPIKAFVRCKRGLSNHQCSSNYVSHDSSSGTIKGSNSPSRVYSQPAFLPPTRLYQAVNNQTRRPWQLQVGWRHLSEAGQQTWHNVLNALEQEANSIRSNFDNWSSLQVRMHDEMRLPTNWLKFRLESQRSTAKRWTNRISVIKTKNERNSADWMQT